jgi:ABC-type glucose/galactose transport system permease subunit
MKLSVAQLDKKFHVFYGTERVTAVLKIQPLELTLNQMISVYVLCVFKTHFNIILPLSQVSPNYSSFQDCRLKCRTHLSSHVVAGIKE